MLISSPRRTIYKDTEARLFVLRNNGYCWGRLVLPDQTQFDVEPPDGKDPYDWPDWDAADLLEEQVAAGRVTGPLHSMELWWGYEREFI